MIKNARIKKWFYTKKEREKYSVVSIFNVDYAHLRLQNDDDFFITSYGLSQLGDLNPADFRADSPWFKNNSERLDGTGCVYKVRTKKVNGRNRNVIIKWNRMGEDVPGAKDIEILLDAKFNSPFEEFALVKELRDTLRKSSDKILLQKPLAIYVPSERYKSWQTGRNEHRMKNILDSHTEIELDIDRLYMVIYEWIEGMDLAQAFEKKMLDNDMMKNLTHTAALVLEKNGYLVRDNKPNHIIIRPDKHQGFAKEESGEIRCAMIDYELLEHTQQVQDSRRVSRRLDYHRRQKDRFAIDVPKKFHPHLHHVNILGVEYVYGQVESTKGRLWTVGKDPQLFDFFQPERWEGAKRTKISMFSESYYTVTKDNIHIVWEVSKVGLLPDMDPFLEDERTVLEYGYNSPFEEVALAVELSQKGIATIYPRAIYMTSNKTVIIERLLDKSRFEKYSEMKGPDGLPILQPKRTYIIIWGYWNGPDERLAEKEDEVCEGINMLYAYREGVVSHEEYMSVVQNMKERLQSVGVEDLNLSGKHLLISVNAERQVIRDSKGNPDIRICNFEFLKKTI
jgi:hypothetical protein